jgi:hypothetical protein
MVVSLLFIVGGAVLSVVTMLVVRRLAPPGGYLSGMESADGIFSAAGAGLAVVLAFVIFTVFSSYENGREASGQEAVAVQQMFQTAGFFPDQAEQLRGEAICYGRSVVNDEWPAMQQGRESAVTQGWVDRLVTTIQQADVKGNRGGAALEHWLQLSEDRQEARRTRIAESDAFVPGFVWVILILMVVVVVTFQCLFADPSATAFGQSVAMASMTATLFAGLTLVWVLDRPFNDRGAEITPTRMSASLAVLNHQADLPATLPCDADGNPT